MIKNGIVVVCDRNRCDSYYLYPLSPRVAPSVGDYVEARKAAADRGWAFYTPRIGERMATCPECLLGDCSVEDTEASTNGVATTY